MNNNSVFLLNPEFNTEDAINCNLLLSVNEMCFSYAVISNDNQIQAIFDIQACEDVDKTIENRFNSDELLSLKYNTIKAVFHTENELLVPVEFYVEAKIESFRSFFNQPIEKIHVNEGLAGFNAIFGLKKRINDHFEEKLASGTKYHHVAPMLALADEDGLYLDFTAFSVYFVFKNNGKIIYQNQHQIANAEEFNYYLLLILNILNIKAKETDVKVSGIINEGDAKHLCLQQFFTTINFINPKRIDINNSILENLPQHYFSALLALNLCA